MNDRNACMGTGLILESLHARVWQIVRNPVSDFTFAIIGKIGSGRRSTAVVGAPVFPMVNVGKADHKFTTVEFDDGEFPVHPLGRWIGDKRLPRFFEFLPVEFVQGLSFAMTGLTGIARIDEATGRAWPSSADIR